MISILRVFGILTVVCSVLIMMSCCKIASQADAQTEREYKRMKEQRKSLEQAV